jgi:hypothetical protein
MQQCVPTFGEREADGSVSIRVFEVEVRDEAGVAAVCGGQLALLHLLLVFDDRHHHSFVVVDNGQMDGRLSVSYKFDTSVRIRSKI